MQESMAPQEQDIEIPFRPEDTALEEDMAQSQMVQDQVEADKQEGVVNAISQLAQAKANPVQTERKIAAVNEDAESPYQKEAPKKDLQSDNYSQDFRDLINQYKQQMNAPEKDTSTMDNWGAASDILNQAARIEASKTGAKFDAIEANKALKADKAAKSAKKAGKLSQMEKLAGLIKGYQTSQNKGKADKFKEAKLKQDQQKIDAKSKEMSFEEKENVKQQNRLRKDNLKVKNGTKKTTDNLDTQLEKIRRAKKLMKDMTKNKLIDTGPMDQYAAGFKSEGQQLRQAFNDLSLEKMSKLFAGMSKAIDSDAERKMFEQSQASLGNYPDVNMQILDDMEKGVISLKEKNARLYDSYDKEGNEVNLEDSPIKEELPETVLMLAPNGQTARVKRSQIQKYLDKGAKEIKE